MISISIVVKSFKVIIFFCPLYVCRGCEVGAVSQPKHPKASAVLSPW